MDREVHVESHRRMSGMQPELSQLSPLGKLTRTVLIETVELPDTAKEIRDELTVFQAELDMNGLAEDS
jgi:hypothetical protein